jgi:hypothetical protein
MASTFVVTLDTQPPAGVDLQIDAGATFTSDRDVIANISITDPDPTGYQIKIWGDVDESANASIQQDEVDSDWIAWNPAQPVRLSTGDGVKTLNVKVRDDVWNESSADSDTIELDTVLPVISLTGGPDAERISKVSGKRVVNVQFASDVDLVAWKVKVVPLTTSLHDAGQQIGNANGSTGVTGGALAAGVNQAVAIDGRDLDAASPGDSDKIIKIFGQDAAGNWSANT